MAEGNVQIISNLYEAFARREMQTILAAIGPQIEVTQMTESFPGAAHTTDSRASWISPHDCFSTWTRVLMLKNWLKLESGSSCSATRAGT